MAIGAARKNSPKTQVGEVVRILILDEDPGRLTELCRILNAPGLNPVGARSLAEAGELLSREDLLTIVLPVTGPESFQIVRKIRGRPTNLQPPILLLFKDDPGPILAESGYSIQWADVLVISAAGEKALRAKIDFFREIRRQNLRLVEQSAHLEAERRFHALLEALPELIWTTSAEGDVTYQNARIRDLFGDISGFQWRTFVHPDDLPKVNEFWSDSLRTGKAYDVQCRFRNRKGRYRWYLVRAVPIHNHEGRIVQWFGVCTDIHNSAVEFSKTRQFLDSLVENLPDMGFVKDASNLRFVRVNRAAEHLMSYSRKELIGKNDHSFFPKEQADFFNLKDRQALSSGKLEDITEEPLDTPCGRRYLHT